MINSKYAQYRYTSRSTQVKIKISKIDLSFLILSILLLLLACQIPQFKIINSIGIFIFSGWLTLGTLIVQKITSTEH